MRFNNMIHPTFGIKKKLVEKNFFPKLTEKLIQYFITLFNSISQSLILSFRFTAVF